MATGTSAKDVEREFDRILSGRLLETVFQPIVELDTGATVGYEAFVRGPAGSTCGGASALIDLAYRTGRVVEFDWVARAAACRSAMAAGLSLDQLLFLNIEPLALGSDCPPDLWTDIEHAFDVLQVVLEVTERSLARDTRSLLEGIDRQRPAVAGLAIDDLGADTATLSMLPILAPDVIKLDLAIAQGGPSENSAKVLNIAYEEAERTGATILAEGAESQTHADFAREVGAGLVQGHYFGEPGVLPPDVGGSVKPRSIRSAPVPDLTTPFEALEGWTVGRADDRLLTPLNHAVAYREVPLAQPALVLVLVPDAGFLSDSERLQLADLARRGVITGALGPGLPTPLVDGVLGAASRDHRLDGQWAVVTLSPGTASAVLARELPGSPRRFEFGVTHDRRRVIAAARCLLRHLAPP